MTPSDWIAIVGIASGLAAFVVGLLQYSRAQQWKRAEFVAAQMKAARKPEAFYESLASYIAAYDDTAARKLTGRFISPKSIRSRVVHSAGQ